MTRSQGYGTEVTLAGDLMPTMQAAAALMYEAGKDIVFASELAEALGYGWLSEEETIRGINKVLRLDPTLPSWLLSTFRDGMRTELVLANYHLVPAHARFIARSLPSAVRLRRLVIHFAHLGDAGVTELCKALGPDCRLVDLHLAHVGMGDTGARALAAAIVDNRSLDLLNLEGNSIGDSGAMAIAAALQHNRSVAEIQLTDNCIGHAGLTDLQARFAQAPRRPAYLTTHRQRTMPHGLSARHSIWTVHDAEQFATTPSHALPHGRGSSRNR
jgi:hypothetical protein